MHRPFVLGCAFAALVACKDQERSPTATREPVPPHAATAASAAATSASPSAPVAAATAEEIAAPAGSASNVTAVPSRAPTPAASPVAAVPPSGAAVQPSAAPSSSPPASAPSAAPQAPGRPVFAHASGDHVSIDASAPGDCRVGADCVATIRVQALGTGFHVNKAYPHKFVGREASGLTFVGGNVFGTKNGAFSVASDTIGVFSVRFRGDAAGAVVLAGTVKTSVCTETDCHTPEAPIGMSVPMR